jgi:hypothetical protein
MNFEDNIKLLQAAQGDSQRLAEATLEIVLAALSPELSGALQAVAVPHWFDEEILGALLQTDKLSAERISAQLRLLSMVESFPLRSGWNITKDMRIALRRRLARTRPEHLHLLSARAASYFEKGDSTRQTEAIYHRLLAFPDVGAAELERFYESWREEDREVLQTLGIPLDELIMDGLLEPVARATVLLFFCRIRPGRGIENQAREASNTFQSIGYSSAEVEARHCLGKILHDQGRQDEALKEFEICKNIMLRQLDPSQVSILASCLVYEKGLRGSYDVFLSYNSKDREAVISVASNLMQVGLRPWLDEWDLVRNKPWIPQLTEALGTVNCTAVFWGKNGTGPWQEKEQDFALQMAVQRGRGIVIILLPDAVDKPGELPGFLNSYPVLKLVATDRSETHSFRNLVLGIMGEKPGILQERAVDAFLVAEVQERQRQGLQR